VTERSLKVVHLRTNGWTAGVFPDPRVERQSTPAEVS
jgi:hypothetical protein